MRVCVLVMIFDDESDSTPVLSPSYLHPIFYFFPSPSQSNFFQFCFSTLTKLLVLCVCCSLLVVFFLGCVSGLIL
eukprot:m.29475 g.29475  ORF g.29475 m.29475 type:complete len:75 (-) comp9583_c0_seq2:430-654(-)